VITDATRDAVKRAVDIADLVAQYVPLRKSGRRMVARCPFHQEKTPSFSVDPDGGLYHCFGCKAGGDVISFYERIEGFQYVEAVTALAERAGIEIDAEMPAPQKAERARVREQMERLYEVSTIAARFYFDQLSTPAGQAARAYIEKRSIPTEIVSEFGLGYAPAAWDALALEFYRCGVSPADGEAAGLLIPNKHGGWYDRFRHRLMFPILDRRSRVIAFSGRILPGAPDAFPAGIVPEDAGKYINSPETPLYRKGDHLFGLAAARRPMVENAEAVLVEGNVDVCAMHAAGINVTVAPLGTAFTEAQARLLRRCAETVTIVFDGDLAGLRATRVAGPLLVAAGLSVRVATLPERKLTDKQWENGVTRAHDPDSLLRDGGSAYMTELLRDAAAWHEWLISDLALSTEDHQADRIATLRKLAFAIAPLDDLERDVYLQRAAITLAFPETRIRTAILAAQKPAGPAEPGPRKGLGP